MKSSVHVNSDPAIGEQSTLAGVVPVETRDGLSPSPADGAAHPDHQATDAAADPPSAELPPAAGVPSHPARKWLLLAGAVAGLMVGGYLLAPAVETALNTVSTDDAYVNGYVTLWRPGCPARWPGSWCMTITA